MQVTLKRACFAAIPYTTRMFYLNLPKICNDITSNLGVGQSVKVNTMHDGQALKHPLHKTLTI